MHPRKKHIGAACIQTVLLLLEFQLSTRGGCGGTTLSRLGTAGRAASPRRARVASISEPDARNCAPDGPRTGAGSWSYRSSLKARLSGGLMNSAATLSGPSCKGRLVARLPSTLERSSRSPRSCTPSLQKHRARRRRCPLSQSQNRACDHQCSSEALLIISIVIPAIERRCLHN